MFLPVRRKLIIWIILCVLSCVAALVLHINGDFQLYNAAGDRFSAAFAIPIFTVGAGIFYFGIHLASVFGYWRVVRKHEEKGESQPPPHPLAQALWPYWQFGLTPPRAADVFRVAQGSTCFDRSRALIVCLREVQLPESTNHFFEPLVVAPTGGMRQILPLIVAITLTVAFLDWIFSLGMPRRGLLLMFAGAGLYVGIWVWFRILLPRYYRFAPGIIQVLRFRGGIHSKPVIHSYRMESDTVVVFRQWPSGGMVFDVFRNEDHDCVSIRTGDIDDPTHDQILAAIISTARIPELSETDLVG